MPLYRQILAESWKLTKSRPWLWLFGLLALFLGQSNGLEVLWQAGHTWRAGEVGFSLPDFGLIDLQVAPWLFIVSALLLVMAALAIFIAVTAKGALVLGVTQYHRGGPLNPNQLWQRAAKKFLPLVAIAALFKILILFLTALVTLAFSWIAGGSRGLLVLLFPLLFIAVSLALVVISFLSTFASAYLLLKNKSLGQSVASSWQLFKEHWLVSLELSLVILIISFVLGLAVFSSLVVLGWPITFIFSFSQLIALPALGWTAAIIGLLLLGLLMIWLITLFSVFEVACWTLLFLRFEEGGVVSKLARMFNKLKDLVTHASS